MRGLDSGYSLGMASRIATFQREKKKKIDFVSGRNVCRLEIIHFVYQETQLFRTNMAILLVGSCSIQTCGGEPFLASH